MDFAQNSAGETVAGIVSEYNPFHSGHAWMIDQLRKKGAKVVVCVMSGPFVQRAEAACLPTYLRARAAVVGGADLVFRLPVPWAVASAEGFGHAAVGLLSALGCVDTIAFGAETADTDGLCRVAQVLEQEDFQTELRSELAAGISFAAARANAAQNVLPGAKEVLQSPNNILAVEYCKALRKGFAFKNGQRAMLPRPLALPRCGAAHDGGPQQGIASASWLRKQTVEQGVNAVAPYVPPACQKIYEKADAEGQWIDPKRFELAMMARLRGMPAENFERYVGAAKGLGNRMAAAVSKATELEEMYDLAKTKRFAHSRIRRVALASALGLPGRVPAVPPFLHLLAASENGLSLLKRAKESAVLPLSSSLAKLGKESPEAARVVAAEAAAEDLMALCLRLPQPGAGAFTRPVQVVARADKHEV